MTYRRATDSDDSLDLLLDTISNIFGGIIFIAMLVAVLTSYTSSELIVETQEKTGETRALAKAARAAALEREITDLQQSLTAVESMIDPDHAQERRESARVLEEIRQAQARTLENQKRYEAWLEQFREQFEKDPGAAREKLQQTRHELIRAQQELQREKASKSVEGRLPVQQQTQKSQAVLILKGNRLYVLSLTLPLFNRGPFQDDVHTQPIRNGLRATINPQAGETIQRDALPPKFAALCTQLRPNRYFFEFFVYPDSAAGFRILRSQLLGMGYQYNVSPIDGNGPIDFGFTDRTSVQ